MASQNVPTNNPGHNNPGHNNPGYQVPNTAEVEESNNNQEITQLKEDQ